MNAPHPIVTAHATRLHAAVDKIPEVVLLYDNDRRLRYANKALEQLTGYSAPDPTAINVLDHLHLEDAARIREGWDSVFKGQTFLGKEFRIVRKDRQIRWCSGSWMPLWDEKGQQAGVHATLLDLASRKAAGVGPQPNSERFRALFETASDILWELDADGVYTYCSPNVAKILGHEIFEVIGKTPFDFMPSEDAALAKETFRAVTVNQRPFSLLARRFQRNDGALRTFECCGMPVFGAAREFRGYRGIDRDITDRPRPAPAGAAGREADVERAVSRSELLAQMSPEIQAALSGLSDASDLLLRDDLNPKQRLLAEDSRQAVLRLEVLLKSLLVPARIP